MNLVSTIELTKSLGVTPQRISALAKQLEIQNDEMIMKGRNKHYQPNAVKKILEHRGVNYDCNEIIAFSNNKGGVGKTSLAVNTATRLSSLGFKVLLLDADAQGNSTSYLITDYEYENVLFDVVAGHCTIKDSIIQLNKNLSLLPSNLENSRLDMQFSSMQINQRIYFKNLLKDLDYNYIIWDLSPSISTTNFVALLSCSQVNIVTTLTDFSIQGLEMTNDLINKALENFDDYRPIVRAVVNMLDYRITSGLEHLSSIKNTGVDLFESVIRVDSTMSKTQTAKSALPSGSNAYKDICSFVNELVEIKKVFKTVQ